MRKLFLRYASLVGLTSGNEYTTVPTSAMPQPFDYIEVCNAGIHFYGSGGVAGGAVQVSILQAGDEDMKWRTICTCQAYIPAAATSIGFDKEICFSPPIRLEFGRHITVRVDLTGNAAIGGQATIIGYYVTEDVRNEIPVVQGVVTGSERCDFVNRVFGGCSS